MCSGGFTVRFLSGSHFYLIFNPSLCKVSVQLKSKSLTRTAPWMLKKQKKKFEAGQAGKNTPENRFEVLGEKMKTRDETAAPHGLGAYK